MPEALKAILSPHPYDLEAVEPVIEFQKAKYRFADPVDALAGIDSRPDLVKTDWYKFENLTASFRGHGTGGAGHAVLSR